jgi:hypothetical protein
MNIFPISLNHFANANGEALRITRHELGHHIANQLFNSAIPSNQYIAKAQKDTHSVSEYGNNTWGEDFAEAVEIYLRTDAGRFNPAIRQQLTNRFSFLDDIFAYRTPQSTVEKENANRQKPEIYVSILEEKYILAIAPQTGLGILLSIN